MDIKVNNIANIVTLSKQHLELNIKPNQTKHIYTRQSNKIVRRQIKQSTRQKCEETYEVCPGKRSLIAVKLTNQQLEHRRHVW